MKHEKYFTFDGSIDRWEVDNVHMAAMAHMTDKHICHRRRIPQADGSVLGLMALRSNKDEHGRLFDAVALPGFVEILPNTPEAYHGKFSWDRHDAENEIARADEIEKTIVSNEFQIDENVKTANDNIFILSGQKEQAIAMSDTDKMKTINETVTFHQSEIVKAEVEKTDLLSRRTANDNERLAAIRKRDKAIIEITRLEDKWQS